jgi:hypothetical protein
MENKSVPYFPVFSPSEKRIIKMEIFMETAQLRKHAKKVIE